jgi:uncharacterized protein YutE (UPF0331/DUF86 family)
MREFLDDLAAPDLTDVAVLRDDRRARNTAERALTQLVELAVSINSHIAATALGRAPRSYSDSFRAVADCGVISAELAEFLLPSAGMRNILIHEYFEINLEKVAAAVAAGSGRLSAISSLRGRVRER